MDGLIWVHSTIHLPRLPLGARVQVDPTDRRIRDLLANGFLVDEGPVDKPAD